ncbi:Dbl homology domain-containing protein, partial [Lactarius quietus]
SLDSPAGLESFHAGKVPESEQEWARFVPPQALEALGKHEVERQSALFEVFKSEIDYVNDLRAIQDVYIGPILTPPHDIMSEPEGKMFVSEVFWNLGRILEHHQRMLGSLLTRQRDQHPLVQSVADIILDYAFRFTPEYESYIKHSPLSLELHRKELDRNPHYNDFIRKCSEDPLLRKRDFKTLLSRPITRLPRLKLVLERIQKLTAQDHPDLETIPIVLTILQDFIKSSEPGIEAAEGKVKYSALHETLVFSHEEIIDLDISDDSRTVVHSGPLVRQKHDARRSWSDVFGALLDNYFMLLKEETKTSLTVKRRFVWRPIPLEYLRLGSFDDTPEVRRERADNGSFISISSTKQNLYPFSIYHAGGKASRQYTLYAPTMTARDKWHQALLEAIGVRKARQDANKWYAPQALNVSFFRVPSRKPYAPGIRISGRIICAATFSSQGRKYLAVGCTNGTYVAAEHSTLSTTDSIEGSVPRPLDFIKPTSIVALPETNNVLVHSETALFSYPLDLFIRVSQGDAAIQELNHSTERLAQKEGNVLFCKAGRVAGRTLVVYATKSFVNVTLSILEPQWNGNRHSSSYRSFDTHDVAFLPQTIAICLSKSIHILRPMKWVSLYSSSRVLIVHESVDVSSQLVVPDFSDSNGGANASVRVLKDKCEGAKSLGAVTCEVPRRLLSTMNLDAMSTSMASPHVWLDTFLGSVKPRPMRIVEPTSYFSLLDSSRCAPLPLDSSSR